MMRIGGLIGRAIVPSTHTHFVGLHNQINW